MQNCCFVTPRKNEQSFCAINEIPCSGTDFFVVAMTIPSMAHDATRTGIGTAQPCTTRMQGRISHPGFKTPTPLPY